MAASVTAAAPGAAEAAHAPRASSAVRPADDFRGAPGAATSAVRDAPGGKPVHAGQDAPHEQQRLLSPSGLPASRAPSSPKRMLLPGETALLEYRQLAKKYQSDGVACYTLPAMTEDELDNFGWQWPTNISVPPSPYCLPVQALSHQPSAEEIYKFFFKGTPVCEKKAAEVLREKGRSLEAEIDERGMDQLQVTRGILRCFVIAHLRCC